MKKQNGALFCRTPPLKKSCLLLPILLSLIVSSLFAPPSYSRDEASSNAILSGNSDKNVGNQVKQIFSIARTGSRKQWDEQGAKDAQEISDSWKYVTRMDLAKLIRDCDQTALASYQKKDLVAASDRLYAGLSCAAKFGESALSHWGSTVKIDEKQASPLVWLDVFKALGSANTKTSDPGSSFSATKYIPAVNNYAYYLRLQGNYKESIPIFERIIAMDPQRIVTNLDLADAFWETGEKEKARPFYAKYLKAMQKANFKNVPPRVPERSSR